MTRLRLRRIYKSPLFPLVVRLAVSAAVLLLSIPRLVAVYEESGEPKTLREVTIESDCYDSFSVKGVWFVTSTEQADFRFDIAPDSAAGFGESCTKLAISIPGEISGVKVVRTTSRALDDTLYPTARGQEPKSKEDVTGFQVHGGNAALDLTAIASKYEARDASPAMEDAYVEVTGSDPHFLISRTYNNKLIHVGFLTGPNGLLHRPLKAKRQPWTIEVSLFLDKTYQVTNSWTAYEPQFLPDGQTLVKVDPKMNGAASIFLENMEHTRTRDLQVVFTGALMATGIAIFLDFVIQLSTFLARRRDGEAES